MGQFTIALPNNLQGDVRWGSLKRKTFSLNPFTWKKFKSEVKRGYIVRIDSPENGQKEYRLLKTMEGAWSADEVGGFNLSPEDENTEAIKIAIDHHEKSSS